MIAQIFLAAFLGCLMAVAVAYAIVRHYILRLNGKINAIDPQIQERTESAIREAFSTKPEGIFTPPPRNTIAHCDHCERQQMCPPNDGEAKVFLESIGWRVGDLACPFCADVTRKSLTDADIERPKR